VATQGHCSGVRSRNRPLGRDFNLPGLAAVRALDRDSIAPGIADLCVSCERLRDRVAGPDSETRRVHDADAAVDDQLDGLGGLLAVCVLYVCADGEGVALCA